MDIKTFLFIKDMKMSHMAKRICCAPSYLASISKRRIVPSEKMIKKIVDFTEGLVTEKEILKGSTLDYATFMDWHEKKSGMQDE